MWALIAIFVKLFNFKGSTIVSKPTQFTNLLRKVCNNATKQITVQTYSTVIFMQKLLWQFFSLLSYFYFLIVKCEYIFLHTVGLTLNEMIFFRVSSVSKIRNWDQLIFFIEVSTQNIYLRLCYACWPNLLNNKLMANCFFYILCWHGVCRLRSDLLWFRLLMGGTYTVNLFLYLT